MSLMDLLVWLTGAGSLMAISWAAEYFNWFVGMEPKQKKLVFFGIAAGIRLPQCWRLTLFLKKLSRC